MVSRHDGGDQGEVNKMERKFESELAGQVARRHKNPLKSRAKVLFMTVVSCAVMVAAAAAVLSMQASAALGGPTEYIDEFSGEDYLVDVDGTITYKVYAPDEPVDDAFLVKRTSALKWIEFDTPGLSTVDYTKAVYSVNVKLKDISAFPAGVAGMVVADLDVTGFTTWSPWIASATLSINDVETATYSVITLGELPFMTSSWDSVTGTLSAQVTLPDGIIYSPGDQVSIFVMFKTVEVDLTISGSEIGFPEYSEPIVPIEG